MGATRGAGITYSSGASPVLSGVRVSRYLVLYVLFWRSLEEPGTAYPSGQPEFTPFFYVGWCYSIFSFMCMFCRSFLSFCPFFIWPSVVCPSSICYSSFRL